MTWRTIGSLFALALTLSAGTAAAQTDDPQQLAIARALFEEGLAAYDGGQLEVAEDRFRRSLAIRRSTAVAFNLANLLADQGFAIEPRELLLEAARDEDAPEELRARASLRASELAARVARITVRVQNAPPGAVVRLDDTELGAAVLGVPIPVDPGERHIVVAAGGETLAERTVRVGPGGRETIELSVSDGSSGDPGPVGPVEGDGAIGEPGPAAPASENIAEAWWLWTIVGVVVAGLVVGGVFLGLAADEGRYYTGNVEPGRIVIGLSF